MKTRNIPEIDAEISRLRRISLDTISGSSRWKLAWEKINELLDIRLEIMARRKTES